jgi:hypothetical protein
MQKNQCGHMLADDTQMHFVVATQFVTATRKYQLGQICDNSPQDDTMRHSQADHQLSTPVTDSNQMSTGASMWDLCTQKPTA